MDVGDSAVLPSLLTRGVFYTPKYCAYHYLFDAALMTLPFPGNCSLSDSKEMRDLLGWVDQRAVEVTAPFWCRLSGNVAPAAM